MIGHGQCV